MCIILGQIFYKPDVVKVPRIFGMTASPISGKGNIIVIRVYAVICPNFF